MPVNTRRLRDVGLEVLIAVALVAGILAWAEFGPRHTAVPTKSVMVVAKWVTFMAFTAMVFCYPFWRYRAYHNRSSFRWAFAALLSAHLVVYVPLVVRVRDLGYLWFMVIRPLARIPTFPFQHMLLWYLWIVAVPPLEWAVICPILERAAKRPARTGSAR